MTVLHEHFPFTPLTSCFVEKYNAIYEEIEFSVCMYFIIYLLVVRVVVVSKV